MGFLFTFLISSLSLQAFAYDFQEAIKNLDQHPALLASETQTLIFKEQGRISGAWDRPVFKAYARNLIGETPSSTWTSATAMRHIEFQMSQKMPLTSVYRTQKKAFEQKALSQKHTAQDQKRQLIKELWITLIKKRRIKEEAHILKENLDWIDNNIAVSQRLYTGGRLSQQAILSLQIRKTEIETHFNNKQIELKQQDDKWRYLVDLQGSLDESSIPWSFLETKTIRKDLKDQKHQALEAQVQAKQLHRKATRQAYVPDLTFSVSYTRMLKSKEDFISAGVSLPLPLSPKPFASHTKSKLEEELAIENLHAYQRAKQLSQQQLLSDIEKNTKELQVIDQQTIKFAENSKSITSKAYASGQVDYKTLLESEFQLQKLLLKQSLLKAQLAENQISYKYLIGDDLYEGITQ